ncbi:MAG: alpha-L-fucosidase [Spirochaetaceae bacterium]|nr:MAG: alpha-L-fucosidase [Spirochaetaceae bacterium]
MTGKQPTDWFSHDRFGMFVHWGLYSAPGGVWNGEKANHPYSEWLQAGNQVPRLEYRRLAESFNPTAFNADQWIAEAKRAGMRYFLITAKHHDGFALWPSKASPYNVIDASPFKRDILAELTEACRKHGIRIGFYYSHWQDWEGTGGDICDRYLKNDEYQHPTEEQFQRYWQEKCLVQVSELMDAYDPAFFWFDTWNKDSYRYITAERQDELISLIKSKSDDCLVNSRIQFLQPSSRVDYLSMMDNEFPEKGFEKPWETSGTLNHSWGYHALDFNWKPSSQLVKYLVGNSSLGGNYQLNVGPKGDGSFEPAAVRRLREIGAWMGAHGEAVIGTEACPPALRTPANQRWGRITARANPSTIYLHLWDVCPGTALQVVGLDKTPTTAWLMETGQPVSVELGRDGLWVQLPAEVAGIGLPVIALQFT